MMIKKLFFILCILAGFLVTAQTAISGFIDTTQFSDGEPNISLTKVTLEDMFYFENEKIIAISPISSDGFFAFERNHFDNEETVYRLYLNNFKEGVKDTVQIGTPFIFSKRDTLLFGRSNTLFSDYSNTNNADNEWQGLRKYEAKLKNLEPSRNEILSDAYVTGLKSYSKDSLQTLLVKLIGIKQLDSKNLLDKDILKNKEYYVDLIVELKQSDIDRYKYLFLENKLAFLTTEIAENNYKKSTAVISFLVIALIGLLILVFRFKRKQSKVFLPQDDLSKQEKNIQALILEGKSNKEIANELFISLSTVKTHISNIYNKLRISGRQELLQKYQN